MSELVWSLNGKKFKDFGIYVSSSDGLFDELKPKKTETKDWPEYNGLMLDQNQSIKYESRSIELKGWVEGSDWMEMLERFWSIFGEFRKTGKQRLLLIPFNNKPLIYDVRCEDDIELEKRFRQGRMIGMFKAKLIEYNPVKKVLRINQEELQLSFKTAKWIEVNIDGSIENHKGNVDITKTLDASQYHYISIAGNIDEITDFSTNAEVLWERL